MTSVAQATQTETTGYQGWSNYETWLINHWLTNDESYYKQLQLIVSSHSGVQDQAEALHEWLQLEHEELEITNLWSDIVGSTLCRTNYQEIVEANVEETL